MHTQSTSVVILRVCGTLLVFKKIFLKINLFLTVLGLCCFAWTFSSCGEGGCSLLWCEGISLRWLLLLQSMGSRVWASVGATRGRSGFGFRAVEHGISSCGAWALLPLGMWGLPRAGIKTVSPASAGGFFTTEPPGKPKYFLNMLIRHL